MKWNYNTTVYLIIAAISVTLGIQAYLNIVYYKGNKATLINQVHTSLDKAIEHYYFEEGKDERVEFKSIDSVFNNQSNGTQTIFKATHIEHFSSDSLDQELRVMIADTIQRGNMTFIQSDSIKFDQVKELALKIMVSMDKDTLNLSEIHQYLQLDFESKNWDLPFTLIYHQTDTLPSQKKVVNTQQYGAIISFGDILSLKSQSPYLAEQSELEIQFSDTSKILFKQSLGGVLLSVVLSTIILGALLFLLRIIKKQKQLSEIKNDLISNITHEFKTPITTISTALQGMESFNKENDPEKTKKYLNISNSQLGKLNVMVEKLLETATLDSEQLQINLESISLPNLLNQLVSKHQLTSVNHQINLQIPSRMEDINVDPFHLENALNNLLDNAIKYGGEAINIKVIDSNSILEITVSDNGNGIKKEMQEMVFDKFFRVPQGNVHDVKGFGIGLYYCKKIVEKHNGEISLFSKPGETTFKIKLHV